MTDFKQGKLALKQQHLLQLTKLQFKSEADIEFLEVVREYMKSRADLEVQHSKNLDKLSKTLAQRKFRKFLGPSQIPLLVPIDKQEKSLGATLDAQDKVPMLSSQTPAMRNVYNSFSILLQETETQSKQRNEMAEALCGEIADVIKEFYKQKLNSTKRNIDFGSKYQQEICLAYEEVERTRALYDKNSKDSDAALKKYDDAIKKPKSGMQSLKSMVTGKDAAMIIEKLKNKTKNKSRALNEARNNSLLALVAFNSLQDLYEKEDLPLLMAKIDGNYYKTLSTMLTKFTEVEGIMCRSVEVSMDILREQIALISRQKEVSLFLEEFQSVFIPNPPLIFETVGLDEEKDLVVDDITKVALGQKMGQMLADDNVLIEEQEAKEKEIKTAQADSTSLAPLETEQVHELQNTLDLIKCRRYRLSQQIIILRQLSIAPILPDNTDSSIGKQFATIKLTITTEKEGELNATEGDEVEILDTTQEGVVLVKNIKTGLSGTVPAAHLLYIVKTPIKSIARIVVAQYDYKASEEHEVSFTGISYLTVVGDEIECLSGIDAEEEWWEGRVVRTGAIGAFPRLFTKGWEAIAHACREPGSLIRTNSILSRKLTAKRQSMLGLSKSPSLSSDVSNTAPVLPPLEIVELDAVMETEESTTATALYKYEATCDGELALEAGEIITNITKDTGSDQWWFGKGKGGEGQFPSNYVSLFGPAQKAPKRVKALYDFSPTSPGELSFKAGDILIVKQNAEVDWWDGELGGVFGAFPSSYVAMLDDSGADIVVSEALIE